MADFGVYWRNFSRERRQGDWPCSRWFTNSDRLGRAAGGDRLWLFAAGDACGMAESKRAYLVEILTIRAVVNNADDDGDYPAADFAFTVLGVEDSCLAVDPPLLIDEFIRGPDTASELPIGTVHQGPWKLKPDTVVALQEYLDRERHDLFEKISSGL